MFAGEAETSLRFAEKKIKLMINYFFNS